MPTRLGFAGLLARLVLAGLFAGAVTGLYQLLVTGQALRSALAVERARDSGSSGSPGAELVSRDAQVIGGVVGAVLAALLLAVVLATVYAALGPRLPGRSHFSRLVLLAAVGFAVLALLPAVKLPANPPGVGDPATAGIRSGLYAAVLLSGVVTVVLVSLVVSVLRTRGTSVPSTAVAATAAGAVCVLVVLVVLPSSPDGIPPDVPAALVWDFRVASLGQWAVLWTCLGLAGGWLVERRSTTRRA